MSDDVGSVTTSSGVVENVRVAVGISLISHSVPEKHSTSGLESAILKYCGRLTPSLIGIITSNMGRVENVGLAFGISVISHSVPEKHSTSGLESAILIYDCRLTSTPSIYHHLTSGNVSDVTAESGMVKNIGANVEISAISLLVPDIHCTSGLLSAILNFRHRWTAGIVGSIIPRPHVIENVNAAEEFSLITLISVKVLHFTTFRPYWRPSWIPEVSRDQDKTAIS